MNSERKMGPETPRLVEPGSTPAPEHREAGSRNRVPVIIVVGAVLLVGEIGNLRVQKVTIR